LYAHQAIEDLNYFAQTSPYQKYIGINKLMIEAAQKFNLPDFDKIDISNQKEEIKIKENLFHFRPPYDLCWFDYTSLTGSDLSNEQMKSSKRGVIVLKKEEFLIFRVFSYINEYKRWIAPLVEIILNLKTKQQFSRQIEIGDMVIDNKKIQKIVSEDSGDICHVLQAMSILNCKNIITKDNFPSTKLNKKRKNNSKQELFIYKTLIIKPSGKKQESQESKGLWDNRVHICRGHFKEYTTEKPLFGKLTGRYWWQPYVRGNKDEGTVVKEYEIKFEKAS